MMRCNPIAVTNMTLISLVENNDFLGLKNKGLKLTKLWSDSQWLTQNITLEIGESYVWEVLDAIGEQLEPYQSWQILETNPGTGHGYKLSFFHTSQPIESKIIIIPPSQEPPNQQENIFINHADIILF